MSKKILVALFALVVLAGACSKSSIETTGDGNVVVDGSSSDGADGGGDPDGSGSDDGSAADADGSASGDGDAPADGDQAGDARSGALLFSDALPGAGASTSARFEGTFLMTGVNPDAPDTPVEMRMTGAYDQTISAMEMTMDLGDLLAAGAGGGDLAGEIPAGFEGFFEEPMQFITIGTESWLSWGILSLLTGQEGAWLSLEADEVGTATESFGIGSGATNPTDLLDALGDASAEIQELGTETVRGVETRHVLALVDVQELSADLDPAEQAQLEEQLGDLSSVAYPLELWIGVDDGYVYRYQIELEGDALGDPEAPAGASVVMTFEFFDHGVAIDISPPPADLVVDGSALLGGGVLG